MKGKEEEEVGSVWIRTEKRASQEEWTGTLLGKSAGNIHNDASLSPLVSI